MSGIAAISAGAAVAGAAAAAYGALKKGQGATEQTGAQNQITQEQFNRQIDQERQANEIATWYNAQNQGLADRTDANSKQTIAGADGAAFTGSRDASEVSRAASGNALIDAAPTGYNYADNAPDRTGAVKSENARQLVKALDLGHARANAGAKVNSYGDALLNGGLAIQKGNQGQAAINSDQARTDKIASMRSTLNQNTHVPFISPNAQYDLAGQVGIGNMNTGSALMAGGNVVSALGSSGALKKGVDYFGNLFGSGVPGQVNTGVGQTASGNWFG